MARYKSILHYPLDWPLGYTRTDETKAARFKKTFAASREHCEDQIAALGGSDIIISSDLELNANGSPKASRYQPDDRGVAVYFQLDGKEQVIACDNWNFIEDNLRAVGLTVEALRGISRWGASEVLARAFLGFTALPASVSERSWWQVLEVSQTATQEQIKKAIREKKILHHPDYGGDRANWDELQAILLQVPTT